MAICGETASRTLNTDQIREWRSIVTLIVFVIANLIVLFPFHIPIYVPRIIVDSFLGLLSTLRVIPSKERHFHPEHDKPGFFVPLRLPINFVTGPLIADLFLLAISAIGRYEVCAGTLGAENIEPIDIMAFFITLAYIAISIDASGLIRYLAFKVLQWGGDVGHRLFFYLYAFFFGLGTFIGNDPIILSGTAFLAYMTRVSSNIVHPRAWIYTQFAVANIASAILVTSNPTNLVLAGAFNIKFIDYTAHMVVPVLFTAIVLFPFLLYIVFANESLIPVSIKMHELPEESKAKKPVNPNIPHARGKAEEEENLSSEEGKLLSLEEIMNPFLDKKGLHPFWYFGHVNMLTVVAGALFGAVIMASALAAVLGLNAGSQNTGQHKIFYVTLPAAFVLFCWDVAFGWINRTETREIARKGREEVNRARIERTLMEQDEAHAGSLKHEGTGGLNRRDTTTASEPGLTHEYSREAELRNASGNGVKLSNADEITTPMDSSLTTPPRLGTTSSEEMDEKKRDNDPTELRISQKLAHRQREQTTLKSLSADSYRWLQDTFPTVTAVLAHLPFALIPFAFCMFIMVQALVTKGWVPVFAYGWDHWVNKTGTIGAVGGMGFISVILCNFAGTNIGTTILLCRVIQTWQQIHEDSHTDISDRTFWATVYSMALGVNYGAFSTAFSASLAGLLWRDILGRKHIHVRALDFARINLPIIAIAMVTGCVVLIGEVYIIKKDEPYYMRQE